MKDNLYNEDDRISLLKNYAHVKAHSKTSRLPECMNLNGCYRNNSLDKAEVFDKYF